MLPNARAFASHWFSAKQMSEGIQPICAGLTLSELVARHGVLSKDDYLTVCLCILRVCEERPYCDSSMCTDDHVRRSGDRLYAVNAQGAVLRSRTSTFFATSFEERCWIQNKIWTNLPLAGVRGFAHNTLGRALKRSYQSLLNTRQAMMILRS